MNIALSAVACVMVVIGLGLVVQGTPFTRLEWGWTMVIAGTVTATGGILLAGMAVLAARLGRVERALMERGAPAIAHPGLAPAHIPPLPANAVPVAVAAEPVLPERPRSETGASAEDRAILAASDLIAEPAETPLGPVARLVTAEEPSSVPETDATSVPEAAPEPAPPSVVGTYASGGNAYVMYSDGSIKADTPKGHFTFGSLDELKAFIAEGGEEDGGKGFSGMRA